MDLQDIEPPQILGDFYYFLNEDKTVRICSLEEFIKQMHEMRINDSKHVAKEFISNYWISTVWLGINHMWGEGPAILFETMILNKDTNDWLDYQVRYATWEQAVEGHKRAVQWVLDGCKDE